MSSYIKLYFIFTNGTFTLSLPTYAFLFISHPVPETSIVSNFPKPLHQRRWQTGPKPPHLPLPPSSLAPSLSPSIPHSPHPRSVYGFEFAPRFICSIPMRSTPSPFLFTQIHLITSAAVANQRICECGKKINMAHPGAGSALERRLV